MFQIFNIPRANYSYYRPTLYRKRYVPVESYLLDSIRQAQEIENLRSVLYNSLIHQQYKDIMSKSKSQQTEAEIKNQPQDQSEEIPEIKQTSTLSSPVYYFESHSRFDGENLIEERKERTIDSEGKVHQSLKRILGDQWYETEQIEDKDGQIQNKETWHNVSEDDIENFKKEWISKSCQKLQITGNEAEIENEEDKTQAKDETQNKNEKIENENSDVKTEAPKEQNDDKESNNENIKNETDE